MGVKCHQVRWVWNITVSKASLGYVSTNSHFLTLVRLVILLKSVKFSMLPKYMLDTTLVNSTHFLHMCRCVDWGVRNFQNFFTPVYSQVFWFTPMVLSLHPGFLVYTQDFQFTPRFLGLHPGFWVYTHGFEFTPSIFSLHPGFLVYTNDFEFTPRFFCLRPAFSVYTGLHPFFFVYNIS